MRKISFLLALGSVLLLAACGGGSDGNGGNDTQGGDTAFDASPDSVGPDTSADVPGDQATGEMLVIEFVDGASVMATEGSSPDLQIRAYTTPSYAFATDLTVSFALTGAGDASLGASTAVTDENGMAGVTFVAGSSLGATYTLTASAPGAADAVITIQVVGMKTGAVAVTPVLHFAPAGGETLTLWFVPGTYVCGQTGPIDKPGDTFKEVQVTDLVTPLTVEGLPEAPRWAVVAWVAKADGNPLAGGCVDDFPVLSAAAPTEVTFDLALLDLNATATYAFSATTSLAAWIDPALAEIPAHLEAHFTAADLQQKLHDQMFAALDQKVHTEHAGYKADPEACPQDPPGTCDGQQWCLDLMHAELDANLSQHLANLPSPWGDLADFYDTATALASNVVLKGTVEVTSHVFAPPAHYEYELTPTALVLPDCGGPKCEWTAEELASVRYGIDWGADPIAVNGTITDYDHVQVDAFPLALDPNRVALLVLTEVLGPLALGTTDPYAWFDDRFACNSLAPMFTGAFRTCIWSGTADLQTLCDKLVKDYNQPLQQWLNPLATQRVPELSQTLTGRDPDGNLELDSAEGTLTWTSPEAGAPLEGTVTWSRP